MSSRASPARRVAYRAVRRVSDGAYADRVLRAEAARAGLTGADRAFAQQLAYGAVQRRLTLDHLIERFARRPAEQLDPPLLDALRLGVFQLLWMGSVPDHAAVDESVELAKEAPGSGHRLANAVLRRAAREARALFDAIDDSTPAGAALKHSHPQWIAELWWQALGPAGAVALMERDNQAAESAVRVNTLVAARDEVRAELEAAGVDVATADELPEALVLRSGFDIEGSDLFARGALTPQSRASMLPARVLEPQAGERVLDMCAAPGTKTTHIAALTGAEAQTTAVERNPARADALRENLARMRAGSVDVVVEDARDVTGVFDRVLLDAPCSNLGTLAGRPDARWRRTPEQLGELAGLQAELLDAAAERVRPGGTLVYSVCTISPAEGPGQVDALQSRRPDLELVSTRQTLPHRDHTDGFFIARLEKRAG
jgi:16S rRNA (cytosine967-C5)-methyltransferase